MRHFITIIILSVAFMTASTPVDAGRGGGGTTEFLDLVHETQLPDPDGSGALSLCHLVKKWHAIFIPLWYQSQGYALATNRCDTDAYYSVNAGNLAGLKSDGLIPADTPATPSLSTMQMATPFLWGGLVLLILGGKFLRRGKGSAGQGNVNNAHAEYMARVLEVACRAAGADGKIEDREVGVICAIAGNLTSQPVNPDGVRRMIDHINDQPTPFDYTGLGAGLDQVSRNQLLRVAMMVIGKDEMADGPGKEFIDKLARDLLVTPEQRDALATSI